MGTTWWNGNHRRARAAETAFSTFKRLFGEHSLARSMDCIWRELVTKASLIGAIYKEHGRARSVVLSSSVETDLGMTRAISHRLVE